MSGEFCWYSTCGEFSTQKSGGSSAKVGRIQPPPKDERDRTFVNKLISSCPQVPGQQKFNNFFFGQAKSTILHRFFRNLRWNLKMVRSLKKTWIFRSFSSISCDSDFVVSQFNAAKGPRRKAKVVMMALWAITSSRAERNLAINAPNKLKKPRLQGCKMTGLLWEFVYPK